LLIAKAWGVGATTGTRVFPHPVEVKGRTAVPMETAKARAFGFDFI
jgi:hypothetical protein